MRAREGERPDPLPGAPPVAVSLRADPQVRLGGVVLASVRVEADRDVVLQGGGVELSCLVAYRYSASGVFGAAYTSVSRRTDVVASEVLPGPSALGAGQAEDTSALLAIPEGALPTVRSELVAIGWLVDAWVQVAGHGRVHATPAPVAVLGAGRGASLEGEATTRSRFGVIAFTGLATRTLTPGGQLAGEIVVRPRVPVTVRSLVVELVLRQLVPHGPLLSDDPARNPYVTEKLVEQVVRRVPVLGEVPVFTDVRAPFEVEVADLAAPTLVTDDFSVRWLLRAVVRRRLAGLPLRAVGEIEILGSTTP